MKLLKQCVVVFILGLVVDLLQTVHIQACSDRSVVKATSTIVLIYLVGCVGHAWFVDHKDSWSRWSITWAGALGAGVGTALVIIWGD